MSDAVDTPPPGFGPDLAERVNGKPRRAPLALQLGDEQGNGLAADLGERVGGHPGDAVALISGSRTMQVRLSQ